LAHFSHGTKPRQAQILDGDKEFGGTFTSERAGPACFKDQPHSHGSSNQSSDENGLTSKSLIAKAAKKNTKANGARKPAKKD
jgi:hypothetical protein